VVPATCFTSPDAVDVWDSCFRWREGNVLHDVTIDATWWRVAEAIAAVEGAQAPLWAHQFVDAFSRWHLLPDERLLQTSGTQAVPSDLTGPGAVLNVAAFVVAPLTTHARFERNRFAETATLAVRLLDDALMLHSAPPPPTLRIGIVGFANALHLLGLSYDSVQAEAFARMVAIALAEGSLRGSVDLKRERGALDPTEPPRRESRWHARGLPTWLSDEGLHSGVRHSLLTAIDSHPRLAQLANGVADALDPTPGQLNAARGGRDPSLQAAQSRLRIAMQPYVDAPIDYPLACSQLRSTAS